jgi:hypothetical protein
MRRRIAHHRRIGSSVGMIIMDAPRHAVRPRRRLSSRRPRS